MDAAEVVQDSWRRVQARDWAGVASLLHPDLVVEWPVTGQRSRGPAAFVEVDARWSEGWTIRVLRVVGSGDVAASDVEVPQEGVGTFRAASFWQVRQGLVVDVVEHWTQPGSEQPPDWRSALGAPPAP